MKKTLIAAAALLAIPTGAFARDLPSITVDISDIDLSTAAGQDRLDARVERAIRGACYNGSRGLSATIMEQECRADLREAARPVIEAARTQADAPRYAAVTVKPGA